MRFGHSIGFAASVAAALVIATPSLAGATNAAHPVRTSAPHNTSTTYVLDDGSSVTVDKSPWVMSVGYDSLSAPNAVTIGLERVMTSTQFETHVWYFPASKTSPFSFDTKTDGATLKATNAIASVSLTFKETSSKKGSCSSGSETLYTGTLSGTVKLNTELKPAGTVTATTWTAKGSTPTVTVDAGCIPPAADDCLPATVVSSGTTGVDAEGVEGTADGVKADEVSVIQVASVPQVSGTKRDDGALLDGPTIKPNATGTSVSLTAGTSGSVTGSATASDSKPMSFTEKCTYAGKTYNLKLIVGSPAKWTSPSGKQLVGHTVLTGNLTVPASTNSGLYEVVTVT